MALTNSTNNRAFIVPCLYSRQPTHRKLMIPSTKVCLVKTLFSLVVLTQFLPMVLPLYGLNMKGVSKISSMDMIRLKGCVVTTWQKPSQSAFWSLSTPWCRFRLCPFLLRLCVKLLSLATHYRCATAMSKSSNVASRWAWSSEMDVVLCSMRKSTAS